MSYKKLGSFGDVPLVNLDTRIFCWIGIDWAFDARGLAGTSHACMDVTVI